jgi:hypothetical protein
MNHRSSKVVTRERNQCVCADAKRVSANDKNKSPCPLTRPTSLEMLKYPTSVEQFVATKFAEMKLRQIAGFLRVAEAFSLPQISVR